MAHTDDIAEKLAGLLLDQTARAANFTYDTGAAMVRGVGVLTKKQLEKIFEDLNKSDELRKIRGTSGEIPLVQMKEFTERLAMQTSCCRVADSDVEEYEELLRANKVLYAKADDRKDNCKIFFVLKDDAARLADIEEAINARRGTMSYVKPEIYFRDIAPKNLQLVQGLDLVEHELFQYYARKAGLLYSEIQDQDKYTIAFAASDAQKARKALLHVGWDLTGQGGARVRQQVEYRLKGRSAMQISAMEGKREMYIASQRDPSHYVHITAMDCVIYKGANPVGSVERSDPDFYNKCMTMVGELDSPILFEPGTFNPELTREEVAHYHNLDLHPRDYDTMVEMVRQNELINLVAMKTSKDDEHNATWGLWDPSVSYSEFCGDEYIMDQEEREAREREFEHFKKAAYYSSEHHTFEDIEMDERSLDFVIAKAEERRNSYSQGEPQRSRTTRPDNEQEQETDRP